MPRKSYYLNTVEDRIPFGKHAGKTLKTVMQSDPGYIQWCIDKMDGFTMSDACHDVFDEISGKMKPDPGWQAPVVPREVGTPDGRTITLGDQQHEALTQLVAWASSESRFFTLSGYAGTGKTTLVYALLALTKGRFPSVVVTAPTHKAKKVISRTTGKKAQTVQSLLGLAPATDLESFDPNNPSFKKQSSPQIANYDLCIVDEASMLNKALVKYIFETVSAAKKTDKTRAVKVVFMGDSAQLPPINEDLSMVFTAPQIQNKMELTEVFRQKGDNPLKLIYDGIRSDINSEKDQFLHRTSILEGGEGVDFIGSKPRFTAEVISAFSSPAYQADPDYAKVLCWTNKSVKEWNDIVREALYGKDADYLVIGETLLAYSTVGYGDSIEVENSAEYRIRKLTQWTDKVEVYKEQEPIKSETSKLKFGFQKGSDSDREKESVWLDMWEVHLEPVDFKPEFEDQSPGIRVVHVVIPNALNYSNFKRIYQHFVNLARKEKTAEIRSQKWQEFYNFKNHHLLLHDLRYVDKRGEEKLLTGKDLYYAYAITVHKSQGSTYHKVFVDETDINKNHEKHRERNSLKYVALSRPTFASYVLSPSEMIARDEVNPVDQMLSGTSKQVKARQLLKDVDGLIELYERQAQGYNEFEKVVKGLKQWKAKAEELLNKLPEQPIKTRKLSFGASFKTKKREWTPPDHEVS